jgi:hypothetical protein
VVVADAQAIVFERRDDAVLQVYGCAYGRGRQYDLGEAGEGDISPERGWGLVYETLAGTVVAYEQWEESESPIFHRRVVVIVRNLRTGQTLKTLPTGKSSDPHSVGSGYVRSLVVKTNGSVAWIVQGPMRGTYEVHAVDKDGSRVLASGPGIAEESLALVGSALYWTQDGKPFSATLN